MESSPSSPISNASTGLRKARPTPRRGWALSTAFLSVAAGCTSPTAPVLQAGESCIGQPTTAVATFADPALEARVVSASGVAAPDDLTCGRLAQLPELDASAAGITNLTGIQNLLAVTFLDISENAIADTSPLGGLPQLRVLFARASGITSLTGIQNLTGLTFLDLSENAVADIGALSGLGRLAFLDLRDNSITGLGALSGLTPLRFLYLGDNAITNIAPLGGLEGLAVLYLDGNSISDIGSLSELSGVTTLSLRANSISDISVLGGLTSVSALDLGENILLSDVQPLLDNGGLGPGDLVDLRDTAVACPDINALRAKGVTVSSGCP